MPGRAYCLLERYVGGDVGGARRVERRGPASVRAVGAQPVGAAGDDVGERHEIVDEQHHAASGFQRRAGLGEPTVERAWHRHPRS